LEGVVVPNEAAQIISITARSELMRDGLDFEPDDLGTLQPLKNPRLTDAPIPLSSVIARRVRTCRTAEKAG
jgi:hypothetical protein